MDSMYTPIILLGMLMPGPLGTPAGVRVAPEPAHHAIWADGVGFPPKHLRGAQAKLMARRAAEVIAVRNLARKLGLGRRAYIRGFRYVHTEYRPDGSVRVVVSYPRSHTGRRAPNLPVN